jgi:hypothetical protein
MGYRTTYLGQEVICDTIPELDALLSANTISSGIKRKKPEKKAPRGIKGWAKSVAVPQRELLKALANSHPSALSDTQIKEQLGLASNRKIAGLMGGLAKAAKKSSLPFDSLILKESKRNGTGERHYSYGIAPTAITEVKQGLGLEK